MIESNERFMDLRMNQGSVISEDKGRRRDRADGAVPRPTRPRKMARSACSVPISFSRLNAIFPASSVAPGRMEKGILPWT